MASHFITEHYAMSAKKSEVKNKLVPETYSYYGWLNLFSYNVGLHNEHHDFPFIPWTRLWKLNELASEFYQPLPKSEDWFLTIPKFIFSDTTLFCRVKRNES